MGCRRPWRREIVLPSLSYCIKFLFSLIFILQSSTRHRRWLYRILFLFTSFWTSRTNFPTCFGVSWTFLFFPVKIKINIIIYNILSASNQTSVLLGTTSCCCPGSIIMITNQRYRLTIRQKHKHTTEMK